MFPRGQKEEDMKILKKNQLVIWVIALMLIAAGYLNYSSNLDIQNLQVSSAENNVEGQIVSSLEENTNIASIGDATLVNGELVSNDNLQDTTQVNAPVTDSSDYFVSSKLDRETMYSQMLTSYQSIINSTTISSEQKSIAQQEINKINETKNAIMIVENLMKTKGFADVVIFVNGDSVNAVVKSNELSTQQVAQIQNIISRELKTELEDIHISCK